MATLKIVLLPHVSTTDGKRSVSIRVTHHRECVFLHTPYRLRADEITAGGKIKDALIRQQLDAYLVLMDRAASALGARIDNYTVRDLGARLERAVQIAAGVVAQGIDFLDYGASVASKMRATQPRQSDNYTWLLNKLRIYIAADKLDINAITKHWLANFETWMRDVNKLNATSINNNMRCLRAIYNRARSEYNDEERGEVVIPFYPFGQNKYTIPAPAPSSSRALDVAVIRQILAADTPTKRTDLARDVFAFSFYLMGMNLPDIYRCAPEAYANGRLTYVRAKVEGKRGNDAEISVVVPPEAMMFLRKYSDLGGTHLFNLANTYSTSKDAAKAVNIGLKQIAAQIGIPALTLYYARHSFATIAHSDYGASIAEVGACLNHAVEDNKVTMIYTRKDYARNDEIQRGVIDIVAGKLDSKRR